MAHSDSTVTPHDEYERRHLRRKWHRMKYTAKFKSIIVLIGILILALIVVGVVLAIVLPRRGGGDNRVTSTVPPPSTTSKPVYKNPNVVSIAFNLGVRGVETARRRLLLRQIYPTEDALNKLVYSFKKPLRTQQFAISFLPYAEGLLLDQIKENLQSTDDAFKEIEYLFNHTVILTESPNQSKSAAQLQQYLQSSKNAQLFDGVGTKKIMFYAPERIEYVSNATYLTDARQTGPILNKISGTVDNLLLVGLNNDTNMATEYGLQNSSVTVVPDGVNSIPDIVKHILGFSTTAIPTTPPALPTETTVKSSTGKTLVPVSAKSPSTIPHNSSTTVHQPPTLPHNLSTPIHSTTPPALPTEATVKSSTGKSLVPITNKSPSTIPHNSSTTAIPTTPHVVSTSTSGQTAKTTEKPVKSSTTPEPLKTTTNREVPKTTSTQEPEFSTEFPEPPEVVIIKEAIEEPVKFSNQESSTVATIPTEPIDQPVKSSTTVLPEQPAVVAIKTEAIEQSVKSPEVPAVVAIKEKAIAQPVGSQESSTVATIPTEPTDQPTTPTTVLPEQPAPFEGIIKINTAENSANQTKFEKASVYLYHLLG